MSLDYEISLYIQHFIVWNTNYRNWAIPFECIFVPVKEFRFDSCLYYTSTTSSICNYQTKQQCTNKISILNTLNTIQQEHNRHIEKV